MPIVALALALFIYWLFAELKLGRTARIASGILCMVLVGFGTNVITLIIPKYESDFHKANMELVATLLTNGETQRVWQGIQAYTNAAATHATYGAALEMWDVLNNGPKR